MALQGQQLTAGQLAAALPDVAQASLYRHIKALSTGGVFVVVAENPIRGPVEKVYEIAAEAARLQPADVAGLDNEGHLRYFTVFISSLLTDFSRYLEKMIRLIWWPMVCITTKVSSF